MSARFKSITCGCNLSIVIPCQRGSWVTRISCVRMICKKQGTNTQLRRDTQTHGERVKRTDVPTGKRIRKSIALDARSIEDCTAAHEYGGQYTCLFGWAPQTQLYADARTDARRSTLTCGLTRRLIRPAAFTRTFT